MSNPLYPPKIDPRDEEGQQALAAYEDYAVGHREGFADFVEFANANPSVEGALVRWARWFQANGWKRGSLVMVFEMVRYEPRGVNVQSLDDSYKMSNDLRPFYNRWLRLCYPELREWMRAKGGRDDQP